MEEEALALGTPAPDDDGDVEAYLFENRPLVVRFDRADVVGEVSLHYVRLDAVVALCEAIVEGDMDKHHLLKMDVVAAMDALAGGGNPHVEGA